jgi:hypothetical protein
MMFEFVEVQPTLTIFIFFRFGEFRTPSFKFAKPCDIGGN